MGKQRGVGCIDQRLGDVRFLFEHVEAGGQDGLVGQRPGKRMLVDRSCRGRILTNTPSGPSACRTSALIHLVWSPGVPGATANQRVDIAG